MSLLIISASLPLGITNLPKTYNPVSTILVYSGLLLVSEVFLCKFVLLDRIYQAHQVKTLVMQSERSPSLFSGIVEWENHPCSRVQCLLMESDRSFPWTINFLPAQVSFRSQWVAFCLTCRHPSIWGDHVFGGILEVVSQFLLESVQADAG